jgi:hypothetical protein
VGLREALFPAEPRGFRGRRALKVALRAAHVLCAGVLTGAYVLGASEAARHGWLWAAVGSGGAILLLDLHESAAFLLQLRGFVMAAKLALLALLPLFAPHEAWVLAGLVLGSVASSHAPAAFRYRVLVGGSRVRGGQSRG